MPLPEGAEIVMAEGSDALPARSTIRTGSGTILTAADAAAMETAASSNEHINPLAFMRISCKKNVNQSVDKRVHIHINGRCALDRNRNRDITVEGEHKAVIEPYTDAVTSVPVGDGLDRRLAGRTDSDT